MIGFERATAYMPTEIREIMKRVPDSVRSRVQEIRLRTDAPITLSTPQSEYWVTRHGDVSTVLNDRLLTVDKTAVEQCFEAMCDYSVHTHQAELSRGFITTHDGIRVGLSGTVVVKENRIASMRQLTGLCVRVSRQHDGCARRLVEQFCEKHRLPSVLLCGEPSSGKTSLLRDIARQLSLGVNGRRYRVAVLDERGELSAGKRLIHCDVLLSCPKGDGIEQAVRCLAPDVIVFDEVGTAEEAAMLHRNTHTGTAVITSAHCRDAADLAGRDALMPMIRSGVFDYLVFLKGRKEPGAVENILATASFLAQYDKGQGR